MSIRTLLIDDSVDFRRLLRQHILTRWPDSVVVDHDPAIDGVFAPDFDGSGYDVVLLDYNLGDYNGLDWLKNFRKVEGFPPVIMITGEGTETLAVRVIKAGASDYIVKQDMNHSILVSAIEEAVDKGGAVQRYEWFEAEKQQSLNQGRDLDAGFSIEGHRRIETIGKGGFGAVYLMERESDKQQIVIKVQRLPRGADAQALLGRFRREMDLLNKVADPSIVHIHKAGLSKAHIYQVMDYFPEGSLREHLLLRPMSAKEALNYSRNIARALHLVHRAGVLHRDLKPANVMLRGEEEITLIDFGAALPLHERSDLTQAGAILGTPYYMSPEQARDQDLDARSDLYSLGVVMYEMLMKSVPYTARTPMAILYKHCHAPLPQLPEALARFQPILERLMAKEPSDRYKTANELGRALRDIAES